MSVVPAYVPVIYQPQPNCSKEFDAALAARVSAKKIESAASGVLAAAQALNPAPLKEGKSAEIVQIEAEIKGNAKENDMTYEEFYNSTHDTCTGLIAKLKREQNGEPQIYDECDHSFLVDFAIAKPSDSLDDIPRVITGLEKLLVDYQTALNNLTSEKPASGANIKGEKLLAYELKLEQEALNYTAQHSFYTQFASKVQSEIDRADQPGGAQLEDNAEQPGGVQLEYNAEEKAYLDEMMAKYENCDAPLELVLGAVNGHLSLIDTERNSLVGECIKASQTPFDGGNCHTDQRDHFLKLATDIADSIEPSSDEPGAQFGKKDSSYSIISEAYEFDVSVAIGINTNDFERARNSANKIPIQERKDAALGKIEVAEIEHAAKPRPTPLSFGASLSAFFSSILSSLSSKCSSIGNRISAFKSSELDPRPMGVDPERVSRLYYR